MRIGRTRYVVTAEPLVDPVPRPVDERVDGEVAEGVADASAPLGPARAVVPAPTTAEQVPAR